MRFKLGDLNDALPTLERAAERSPQSKVIHYHLAMAELKAGQRDKARTNLETALSGTPRFTGTDEARATLNTLRGANRAVLAARADSKWRKRALTSILPQHRPLLQLSSLQCGGAATLVGAGMLMFSSVSAGTHDLHLNGAPGTRRLRCPLGT